MPKIINPNAKVSTTKTVGITNPLKAEWYDKLAAFIAQEINDEVHFVKPSTYKCEETGKTKRTGGYGLVFEVPKAGLVNIEVIFKKDDAELGDFIIEATVTPE